jgi:uncharacterized protein YegP (UPF0339 family)
MIRHISALFALFALSLSTVACTAPTAETDSVEAEETTQDLVSRSAYFETYQSIDGRYYFNLMAGNGENVLRSEGYTRLANAENGVASVLAHGEAKSFFNVKQAQNGDWYFTLQATNGQVIGTSELYASKSNAERGASTVRALVKLANQQEETKTQPAPRVERFEIFKGEDGKSYFRLRAANGEIMLGSQGYTTKQSAKKGIESVVYNGSDAEMFQIFPAWSGGWGIKLVAGNGEVIARGETYATKSNATRAVNRLAEILSNEVSIGE